MLQLTKFYEKCYEEYNSRSTNFCPVELFQFIADRRKILSRRNVGHFIDSLLWTDKTELIDRPDFDENLKREIVLGLHLKNSLFGTYKKTIELLTPMIEEINIKENRPARLLEIGSGSGQLLFALYNELSRSHLKFELTGSDVVQKYLDEANKESGKKNLPVEFIKIDAFHLENLPENSYDVVFCLHSLHHFSPAQLAKIMAGSFKISSKAFLGVDGYRGLLNLLFMVISGGLKSLLSLNYAFLHDSFLSGRKLYSAKQLELISRLSCPFSTTVARNLKPGLTMIKIEHR